MGQVHNRNWLRPRYSLTTLFFVVTVLCCWLGWESSIVRERRAVLNEIQANGAFQITTAEVWATRYPPGSLPPGMPVPAARTVPLVRKWLGDEAVPEIWYTRHYQGFSESQLSRLKKVFPEAELQDVHAEPCHPGCFPRGTLVDTPQGPRHIESIRPGDWVTAIGPSGEPATATVQSVFVSDNRLWKVDTQEGPIFTTETQPLCMSADLSLSAETTRKAGDLRPADSILRRQDGDIHCVKVLAVSATDRTEKVFNLVLGNCEIFVAGGFLARSKPPPVVAAQ